MRLRIFKADKGDCLLLTSNRGANVLIDGGMRDAFYQHVLPYLARIHRRRERLDLMYCSHIDRDHIWGLMALMDELVAWRVHEYQIQHGNASHPRPEHPRPPDVAKIWHNGFHEQTDLNMGDVEDLLSNQAKTLSGHSDPLVQSLASGVDDLAASVGDAIHFSRRIGEGQLKIPLNPEFDGGFMYHYQGRPIQVGGLRVTVVGPFKEDLMNLRVEWNDWLRRNQRELGRIHRRTRGGEGTFGQGDLDGLLERLSDQAGELAQTDDVASAVDALAQHLSNKVLGNRQKVTVPNLASLMLLVEEGNKSVLLTGDGHFQDVLDGLELADKLDASGSLHVNVFKVQHHGSEHNTHLDFCRAVTANHYVFCGNGAHENPDLDVVDAFLDSRIGTPARRSENAQVNQRFKLWFNYASSNAELETKERRHMRELERLVRRRGRRSRGRMRYEFVTQSHRAIPV